jgi:uroporphyrinogen III methyltransferase/synthase
VFLVGAGPGDPGLITVRGLALVRTADVIVHDALGATSFLAEARPDAVLINAGKRAGAHTLTQDEINATLVREARAGRTVVRLKGGDPMVFGRGGEELEALAAAGVPFEVVPGVTSAIAGPAAAGIPVTHRDFTSEVAIVTGHDAEPGTATPRDAVPWASLAGLRTIVFLMGVRQLPHIVRNLIEAGKDPATPVALIEQATSPRQRCVTGTLATIVERAQAAAIQPPSIIVVGRVVELRERLAWLEKRPLFGRTIVVTRSRAQAGAFCQRLEELGATVLPFPTIRIERIDPKPAFAAFLDRLVPRPSPSLAGAAAAPAPAAPRWTHLVFTSVNGAEAFWDRLFAAGLDARALAGVTIVCIGPVTAEAFRRRGVHPDVVPDTYVAEALLPFFQSEAARKTLATPPAGQPPGRVAILRAETARDVLPDTLRREGWEVEVVVLYRTVAEAAPEPQALAALREGRVDAVTFTSSSTVEHFLRLIDGQGLTVSAIPAVSIGPVTTATIQAAGLRLLGTAAVHTIPGLTDCLVDLFRR